MRKLSECKPSAWRYAYCENCKEYFIDDVLIYGSVSCPNAASDCKYVLHRGWVLHKGMIMSKEAAGIMEENIK